MEASAVGNNTNVMKSARRVSSLWEEEEEEEDSHLD